MKRILFIVISIVVIFVPMAQAENAVDSEACVSGEMLLIHMNPPELMVGNFELKGIVLSNNNSEVLNNVSEQCVGLYKMVGGESKQSGYCKYLYPNKDINIIEWEGGSKGGTWKFILGTGKWKGRRWGRLNYSKEYNQ